MRFAVGLFDALFGKRVQVEFPRPGRPPILRSVTKQWLDRMQVEGKIQQVADMVPVHMLGLSGYELQYWQVGRELGQDSYDEFYDRDTAALYAMCVMRDGKPQSFLFAKEKWMELRAQLDEVG